MQISLTSHSLTQCAGRSEWRQPLLVPECKFLNTLCVYVCVRVVDKKFYTSVFCEVKNTPMKKKGGLRALARSLCCFCDNFGDHLIFVFLHWKALAACVFLNRLLKGNLIVKGEVNCKILFPFKVLLFILKNLLYKYCPFLFR